MIAREVFVLIPAAMEELHEAHAPLYEAAGLQAVGRVGAALAGGFPIEFPGVLGLVFDIGDLRNGFLHPEGEFILGDPGAQFRIVAFGQVQAIQGSDIVKDLAACCPGQAGRVVEVENRRAGSTQTHALMLGREKAAAPEAFVERLPVGYGGRSHDHEGGKVFVERSQSVGEPGSETGAARTFRASLEEGDGRIMIDGIGVHRLYEAEAVGNAGGVGHEFADPGPGLAVLLEVES